MLPSEYLDAPYPEAAVPDGISKALHWSDWLSPSHDVLAVIELVTGYNPLEATAEKLAGDWRGFAVCEAAVDQLREYFAALALSVNTVADDLDAAWDGHAASAAVASFATSANTIATADGPLADIASNLRNLATAVNQQASLIVTLEEKLIDKGITMAVKSAAAAATSETIIGGILFGALAAADAAEVLHIVAEIGKAWDLMMLIVDGTLTTILSGVGTLKSSVATPLDLTAYHHPGVK